MSDTHDEGAATEMVEAYGMSIPLDVSSSGVANEKNLDFGVGVDFLLKFIIIGESDMCALRVPESCELTPDITYSRRSRMRQVVLAPSIYPEFV